MSKSVKRVMQEASDKGLSIKIIKTEESARTAQEAANFVGCHVDQIGKSILLAGVESGTLNLFLTPGGRMADTDLAGEIMGEPTAKADAAQVRANTGFAIGGVSPIGHLNPITVYICPELLEFETVWVAAGTPHHLFEIDPKSLAAVTSACAVPFLTSV